MLVDKLEKEDKINDALKRQEPDVINEEDEDNPNILNIHNHNKY